MKKHNKEIIVKMTKGSEIIKFLERENESLVAVEYNGHNIKASKLPEEFFIKKEI